MIRGEVRRDQFGGIDFSSAVAVAVTAASRKRRICPLQSMEKLTRPLVSFFLEGIHEVR